MKIFLIDLYMLGELHWSAFMYQEGFAVKVLPPGEGH